MMRNVILTLLLCGCFSWHPVAAAPIAEWAGDCPMARLKAERLPDLNVPRGGHSTLYLGGEVVVVGGHTSGFLPTATAEYLRDGKWHLLETVYSHDHGFSLQLRSGRVLIGGGHEKPLGIGQVHHVEWYDPVEKAFEGFGCLDTRRVFAQAAELSGGEVVISGNWYHTDNTEVFDGRKRFAMARGVTNARCFPFIFPTSDDDAVIFGRVDTVGGWYDFPQTVDRLRKEPFDVPLLATWQPHPQQVEHRSELSCIGDTARGEYAFLLPVENRESQMAIMLVRDTVFSFLPTTCRIPMEGPWGHIYYFAPVLADRVAQRGYMCGRDEDGRYYVLAIDYSFLLAPDGLLRSSVEDGEGAALTLYYTANPLADVGETPPVLTDDGDIVVTGGVINDNFVPQKGAYILRLGNRSGSGVGSSFLSAHGWQLSLLLGLAVIVVAAGLFRWRRQRTERMGDEAGTNTGFQNEGDAEDLMERISQLMEREQLYLRNDLKLQDIAAELGISHRVVSKCIASKSGCTSFSQFVNGYRVEHAKNILRNHPEKKMTIVGMESGFANDTSFFRTFKTFTGITPREWLQAYEPSGEIIGNED